MAGLSLLSGFIGKDYQARLDQDGRDALDELKKQFGSSNLLNQIRNQFSFHFDLARAEAAFNEAVDIPDNSELWTMYLAQHGFNTFYTLSDVVIAHAIWSTVPGELPLAKAYTDLLSEVTGAAIRIFRFTAAFTAAVWIKHFGIEMVASEEIRIEAAPALDTLWLPFFVEMSREQPLTSDRPND